MTPAPALAVEQCDHAAMEAFVIDRDLGARLTTDDMRALRLVLARHRTQALATRDPAMPEGDDAVRIIASALCEARGMDPDGGARTGYSWRNHEDHARRVRASLPAARAGWRGIESADRKTTVDLWSVFDNGGKLFGERLVNCRWREESATYETGWHDCFGNKIEWSGDDGCSRYVTHWMPLPAAPLSTEAGAGE